MAEQLTLTPPAPANDRPRTPDEKWARAVALNPHLPGLFADTARQLIDRGIRATANRVAEEIRERDYTIGDEFVFNNTWRRPAADQLRESRPDLAAHMRTRRSS